MRKGPWLLVAVTAAMVIALLVALLLQGDGERDPRALLHAAPAAVDARRTARLTMTIELGSEDTATTIRGSGGVDFGSGAGWFVVEVLGERIELRTDARTLYVLPPGEVRWLATHADEAAALGGTVGSGAGEAIALVDLLGDDPERIEDLGDAEVDGMSTRHLRFEVDGSGALAPIAPPSGVLELEAWIDDRDLPVRQRVRGEVEGVPVVLTLDLHGWGDDLGVPIPPEGEVRDVEAEELQRVFGGPSTTTVAP